MAMALARGPGGLIPRVRTSADDPSPQAPLRRRFETGPHPHAVLPRFLRHDLALAVDAFEYITPSEGNLQLDHRRQRPEPITGGAQELLDTVARASGDGNGAVVQ